MFQILSIFLIFPAIFATWNVNVDFGCRAHGRWMIYVDFYNSTGHWLFRSERTFAGRSVLHKYNDMIRGSVQKPSNIAFYHNCIAKPENSSKLLKFEADYSIFDYVITRMDDLGKPEFSTYSGSIPGKWESGKIMQNSTYAVIAEPSFASQIHEIQLRYPTRRQKTMATQKYSTSSGYGSCSASTSSSSSIDTVINAARPYTVPPRGTVLSTLPPTVPPKPVSSKNKKPCCVQCREAEIRQAETRDYENLTTLARCQETQPYIMLMVSILRNHRAAENAQKVAKIQKNVQKVLLLGERQGFSMENEAVFEQQLRCFCRDVEIRLRAINDVSNDTFHDVSKRFCDALHANPSAIKMAYKNLKAIFKGYEKS